MQETHYPTDEAALLLQVNDYPKQRTTTNYSLLPRNVSHAAQDLAETKVTEILPAPLAQARCRMLRGATRGARSVALYLLALRELQKEGRRISNG